MAYKTGRQRTITYITTVSGTAKYIDTYVIPVDPVTGLPTPTYFPQITGYVSIGYPFGSVSIHPGHTKSGLGAGQILTFKMDVTAQLFSASDTFTWTGNHISYSQFAPTVLTGDISGTITCTCDVEEWAEIGTAALASGGTVAAQSLLDAPGLTTVRLFELPRIGGTATLTLSFVNGSHSMTRTIDGTELALIDYAVTNSHLDIGTIQMAVQNMTATWSCPTTFQGAAVSCPYTYSDSDGSGSYSNGNSLTVTCGSAPSSYTREFGALLKPVKSYNQVGRINAMAQPYPDNINVLVTDHAEYDPTLDTGTITSGQRGVTSTVLATAGVYSSSYAQQWYKVTSTFPHDPGSYLYEWWPLTQVISPASLSTLGENPANNKLSVRSWSWNGATISQAATQSVDASPGATHWAAGAHTTLTGAGPLAITVSSAGTGSLTSALLQSPAALQGTRWTGVDLSGYRYLQITLNHTTGTASAYSITIGGKVWTHDRLGNALKTSSTAVQIDLCAPDGTAGTTDATDTQWPYLAGFSTQSDGWAYGCHNVGSFAISGLHASQSFQLSALSLVKLDHQTMTILPTFTGWVQAYPAVVSSGGAVTTTTYYRRGHDGDTDGAQSWEGTDFVWVRVVTSSSITDTYTPVTIANFVSSLNGASATFPSKGYSASIGVADPGLSGNMLHDDFLNGSLWSGYLGGAGLSYNGSWSSQIDASLGTRNAQFLIESIDWYPSAGDPFNYAGGGYATDAQFAAGAILRGSSIGIVVQANSKPATGVAVSVKKTGASDAAGNATADMYGQYRQSSHAGTGLNYGKGGTSYDTTAATLHTPHPVITRSFYARYRHRASFRDTAVSTMMTGIVGCMETDSRRGWLHVGVGNMIITLHFPSYAPAFASSAYSVDSWHTLRYDLRSGTLTMLGLTTVSSVKTFSIWTSQDGGLTANEVTTVVANSAVLEKDSETGRQFLLYENDDPGMADAHTVYMIATADGWQTTTGPTAVQYAGANLQAILLDSSQDGRASARMTILCAMGGNTVILESTDKGLTWSLDYTF